LVVVSLLSILSTLLQHHPVDLSQHIAFFPESSFTSNLSSIPQTDAKTDCSAKAVSHRLAKLRSGGTARAKNGTSASPTLKSTSRSRAKSTPRKKKQVSEEVDSDGLSGLVNDDEVLSPTAARGKRGLNGKAKPKYDEGSGDEDERDDMEDEYVPLAKRVKAEPVEDGEILGDELVEEEI
jgi:hypothetical protein